MELLDRLLDPSPLVDEPSPLVEEPSPPVEEARPLVEEPSPLVEEPSPLVEEPSPLVEEPSPLVEVPSAEDPNAEDPRVLLPKVLGVPDVIELMLLGVEGNADPAAVLPKLAVLGMPLAVSDDATPGVSYMEVPNPGVAPRPVVLVAPNCKKRNNCF